MARPKSGRLAVGAAVLFALAACESGTPFNSGDTATRNSTQIDETGETRLIERDVEVPEVFQVTADGLWDGRPSLGGVWVAYRDVKDPERVIIRNEANGKFVIGALFRRERENPGPPFQISSDAAAALDMLAGAPATLNVTALRRQEVPIASEATAALEPEDADATEAAIETVALEAPAEAEAETDTGARIATDAAAVLAATQSSDAAAVAAETGGALEPVAAVQPAAAPQPAPAPASSLSKPFIQIGLFGVETNANRTGQNLRAQGVVPLIQKRTYSGKDYWRVVVGPASTSAERAALLRKVKSLGFSDAYFVGS